MKIIVLDEKDKGLEDALKVAFPNFQWAIYRYHTEPYEGDGELLLKTQEGKYFSKDIGHCSCYGTTEYGYSSNESIENHTNDAFDTIKKSIGEGTEAYHEEWKAIIEKAAELEKESQ